MDKIVNGFLFSSIPKIVGTPDYEKIDEVHFQLNSNAESVHSNLSNRALSILYLTVLPSIYNTLSATTFTPLSNPGATPDIPVGYTATQIAALRYAHTTAVVLFYEYDRTDKALFQQLLSTVDKILIRPLPHFYVGYGTVLKRDILGHLYATYANILPSNLHENETRFRAPYDANHPTKTLTDQVKTAVEYVPAGNTPYSPA